LKIAEQEDFAFNTADHIGIVTIDDSYLQKHIDAILKYPLVNKKAIASSNIKL
jgi:phosphomannomutase